MGRLRTAGIAVVVAGALVSGCKSKPTQQQGQTLNVDTPACNNHPSVEFNKEGYTITCGSKIFKHVEGIGETGPYCINVLSEYLSKQISAPEDSEHFSWFDIDCNGADYWVHLLEEKGPLEPRINDFNLPPTPGQNQKYNETRKEIGQEEVEAQWREWLKEQ